MPSFSFTDDNFSHTTPARSDFNKMRVFLVQTAKGLFSSSGGYKANLCLLRYLASRGHAVLQLCYSHREEVERYVEMMAASSSHDPQLRTKLLHLRTDDGKPESNVKVHEFIMQDGIQVLTLESEAFDAAFGGSRNVHQGLARETMEYIESGVPSTRLLDFISFLQKEIGRFSPSHIILNDGLSMKATSALVLPQLDVCRIAVVHSAEQLPFGPYSGGVPGHASSPRELDLLRQLDGIWSVSNPLKQYALDHGQLQTTFFEHHPWTYLGEKERDMPPHYHNCDKRFVGMINPCVVKGSQILISLAEACPQYDFLAYRSWGFDDDIARQMGDLRNMTIRPPCTDMENAWRELKVLLVPSIWFEAWGLVVVEAHLRGIPVLASNAGALPDAMLGLDHVLPVNPIDGKRDNRGVYVPPEQDIGPWEKALNELMNDKSRYAELSKKARATAQQWLKNVDETALEKWLVKLRANQNKLK